MGSLLKILAFLFVFGGSTGMGCSYIASYEKCIRHTEQILWILMGIRQEIQYSQLPIPEICRELAERVEEPYSSMLYHFYQETKGRKGEKCDALWRREIEAMKKEMMLPREIEEILLGLMEPVGYADGTMQIQKIDRYVEKVQQNLQKQYGDKEKQTKIYATLGVMGGLLMGILFL